MRRASSFASTRRRLDVWLVDNGFAESREKAQALILAGRVRARGLERIKAGTPVRDEVEIEVIEGPDHVGRGALKLKNALATFRVDPRDRVAVDIGASTGGFTEVLLIHGACRVYAVDVGRGQLHERLRKDPRVVVRDGVNARYLSPEIVPEPCSLAVVDVSFISAMKILPALSRVLCDAADVVVLVKPQFELERGLVGRGGVVLDPKMHARALERVARFVNDDPRSIVRAACASPITGASGNREFLLHFQRCEGERLPESAMEAMIAAAVDSA
ncbi:MAG: TlyA family RNA methyltransferase [Vicinamibacteria bacterium]|nr:TlyA family RNA methyltransferase [Vicinamibacteria bacterium]